MAVKGQSAGRGMEKVIERIERRLVRLEKLVKGWGYGEEIKHAVDEMSRILRVEPYELIVRDLIPDDFGLKKWVFPPDLDFLIPDYCGYLIWDIDSQEPVVVRIESAFKIVAIFNSSVGRKKKPVFLPPDTHIGLRCQTNKKRVRYVPLGVVIERRGLRVG